MAEIYELEKIEFDGSAFVREKIIRNGTNTGLINVPKRFVGRHFTMVLIPADELEKTKITYKG